jgi:hypothetical protein
MTAPTKNFTAIVDADIDPESPITTGLMTALRDRDQNLAEWLGFGYTPSQAHTHDGVDSALLAGNVAGNLYMFYNYG